MASLNAWSFEKAQCPVEYLVYSRYLLHCHFHDPWTDYVKAAGVGRFRQKEVEAGPSTRSTLLSVGETEFM